MSCNVLGLYGAVGWHPSASDKWVHSSGAALFRDGSLVGAVSEERLSRVKHTGVFPERSIAALLGGEGLARSDIDHVGFATCIHSGSEGYIPEGVKQSAEREFPGKLEFVDHHKSHALLAYLSSPFDDAMVLTFDGAGSSFPSGVETSFYGLGLRGQLYPLIHSLTGNFGLGEVYNALCRAAYLVKVPDYRPPNAYLFMEAAPGKIMGLAAYGSAEKVEPLNLFSIEQSYDTGFPEIVVHWDYVEIAAKMMVEANVADIVARLQFEFEQILCEWLAAMPTWAKRPHLCLGGGCALNILANRRIYDSPDIADVWAHPASSDTGLPIGAALAVLRRRSIGIDRDSLRNPYTGPDYGSEDIDRALDKFGICSE